MNISAALSNESGDSRRARKLTSPRQFSLEFLNLDVDILRKRKPQLFLRKNHYNGILHMASLCRASSEDLLKTHIMLIHHAKKQGNGKRQFKQFNALLVLFPPNCYEWLSVLSPILEYCNITESCNGFQKVTVSKLRNYQFPYL